MRLAGAGLLFTSGIALSIAAASCSGGGGGSASLSPGVYTVAFTEAERDDCAFVPDVGDDVLVTLDKGGGDISLDGLLGLPLPITGTYSGSEVSGELTVEFDWLANFGFDCVESDHYLLGGAVRADDEIDTRLEMTWTRVSGSQCAEAYEFYSGIVGREVSLPCTSVSSFSLVRIGAPPTPTPTPTATPTPIAITGVLTTAWGMAAPLTDFSGATFGTSFFMSGTLGGVALGPGDPVNVWRCKEPDPPLTPQYEITATDGSTFVFQMLVATNAWFVGTHAIDGTAVRVFVDDRDSRRADATGGTVTLHATPTVLGSGADCRFSLGGLPLAGSQDG